MNNNLNITESTSQTARILNHLKECRGITQAEALSFYGCSRLAPRIYELRKMGLPIVTERIVVGRKRKNVARYSLPSLTNGQN